MHPTDNRLPAVAPGGYRWWYFDGISDDGARAFTAIFFIGSVFSPDYALRLRRGEPARAEEHVAVNLALYDRGRRRAWVMTEHGERALTGGDADGPHIGGSAVEATAGGGRRVTVREHAAPFLLSLARVGRAVEGTVELEPLAQPFAPLELVEEGHRHAWRVVIPRARVRVRFTRPDWQFDGVGYHDVNHGDGRLEAAFSRWSWARFHEPERTTVLYAARERSGRPRAWLVDEAGAREVEAHDGPARAVGWGLAMPRELTVGGRRCRPTTLLESAPFYARWLATLDERTVGLGEHLDLDRFRSAGIQFLLRFKTRRER